MEIIDFNFDKDGEVINGSGTYKVIARNLKSGLATLIGWTDENYTHFDILFTYRNVTGDGYYQRGIRLSDLFVSIIDHSSFGFKADYEKDAGYISEKLRLQGDENIKKITQLINGIIKELNK
jgi:hypothetical protein